MEQSEFFRTKCGTYWLAALDRELDRFPPGDSNRGLGNEFSEA